MKAGILAIGTELLGSDRLDTNSLETTSLLDRYGVDLVLKSVVGDSQSAIAGELGRLCEMADVVIVTGGLGPTRDDRTREALCELTGARLQLDETVLEAIREMYRRAERPMPEVNRRQAMVPSGIHPLANDRGTAPGLVGEVDGCAVFLFPGVPRELERMLERYLEPWLAERSDPSAITEVAEVRVACVPESQVEEMLAPVYEAFGDDAISVLARPGEISVRLRASGEPAARAECLNRMKRLALECLGDVVFSTSGQKLEEAVGQELSRLGRTLAVAESCTGGQLGERLTAVAGSSGYFLGGAISYSNQLKTDLLGVEPRLLEAHGAVSQPVAEAMASGARARFGSSYAISITGVAGPGGGTAEKPVGTVHFAVAGPRDGGLVHRSVRFPGDRERVRRQASQFALDQLRRVLLEAAGS